jgi:hypothetical protein
MGSHFAVSLITVDEAWVLVLFCLTGLWRMELILVENVDSLGRDQLKSLRLTSYEKRGVGWKGQKQESPRLVNM